MRYALAAALVVAGFLADAAPAAAEAWLHR